MYFFFGIAGNPPTRIFNQSSASSKSVHQFHGGELLVGAEQKLDRAGYLTLLADRIEGMVKESENPKEAETLLRESLDQADLLPPSKLGLRELITSNPELHTRLSELRAFPTPGEVVRSDNQEAQRLVKEISLEQWLEQVTRG